jgi:hypothetical protein
MSAKDMIDTLCHKKRLQNVEAQFHCLLTILL